MLRQNCANARRPVCLESSGAFNKKRWRKDILVQQPFISSALVSAWPAQKSGMSPSLSGPNASAPAPANWLTSWTSSRRAAWCSGVSPCKSNAWGPAPWSKKTCNVAGERARKFWQRLIFWPKGGAASQNSESWRLESPAYINHKNTIPDNMQKILEGFLKIREIIQGSLVKGPVTSQNSMEVRSNSKKLVAPPMLNCYMKFRSRVVSEVDNPSFAHMVTLTKFKHIQLFRRLFTTRFITDIKVHTTAESMALI